ncbi:MAG TPA: hypothetical protein VLE95_08940 [Chlamydiales bacterium]|nr:hypothetical protein [Chlamydiales bacterium]
MQQTGFLLKNKLYCGKFVLNERKVFMVQFLSTIKENPQGNEQVKSASRGLLECLTLGLVKAAQSIPDLIAVYQQKKQMDALSKDILALDPENKTNQALAKVFGSGLSPEQRNARKSFCLGKKVCSLFHNCNTRILIHVSSVATHGVVISTE